MTPYRDVLSNLENREVRPLDYKYLLFFLGPKIWHFCYFHHDFKHQESFYTNAMVTIHNMQSSALRIGIQLPSALLFHASNDFY